MSSLIRWSPFEELASFHRDVDRVFGQVLGDWSAQTSSTWVPAAEVVSTGDGWTLRMALPGIDPKEVHVDIDGNVLKVSGERSAQREDTKRHVSEIGYGRFERSFSLPSNVAADKVTAKFENGMLNLVLPLSEAAKPRRIEITDGQAETRKVA